MFKFIQTHFIENYQNTNDVRVRERYGIVMSIFCIVCNILLALFKIIVSFISNSSSILADGLNNLSDTGSNIASLCGFKMASKHPDAEHPYGHGRLEYISGLFIGIIIIVVGVLSLFESIGKLINKEELSFSYLALVIIIISILVKIMMGTVNKKAGNLINSETLIATSKDSFNDVILTSATLLSLLVYKLFNLNIDAYIGILVNIIVIKSGVEIVSDLISTLLGKAPDKALIKEIETYVLSNKEILGMHDIIYHDYGPGSRFLTFHGEVDSKGDLVELHDKVDNIENYILGKYGILTTIHIDPVVLNDPEVDRCKKLVIDSVKELNDTYSIHDFRMVKGTTHTNLVFDLAIPLSEKKEHSEIRKELIKIIKDKDKSLYPSFKIEHIYIDD